MDVEEREIGDRDQLLALAKTERNAKQRDRYRAVAMALHGELTQDIVSSLGRAKSFIQRWVYAYRDGGIDAIKPVKQTGRKRKLTTDQLARLTKRLDAGLADEDRVCTLPGREICSIIEEMFSTSYSLNGVYKLLRTMGYSSPKQRTHHEKNTPQAMPEPPKNTTDVSQVIAKSTQARGPKPGSRRRPT